MQTDRPPQFKILDRDQSKARAGSDTARDHADAHIRPDQWDQVGVPTDIWRLPDRNAGVLEDTGQIRMVFAIGPDQQWQVVQL